MKQFAFCVFDAKTAVFGLPFFSVNRESGKRLFADLVNDGSSLVARFPEDFSLFCVGEFDDDTGWVQPLVPETLGIGTNYVRRK